MTNAIPTDTASRRAYLERHGYRVETRAVFAASELPEGLLARALEIKGDWVVFDPSDDGQGFMLVSDDLDAIVAETYEMVSDSVDAMPKAPGR